MRRVKSIKIFVAEKNSAIRVYFCLYAFSLVGNDIGYLSYRKTKDIDNQNNNMYSVNPITWITHLEKSVITSTCCSKAIYLYYYLSTTVVMAMLVSNGVQ